MLVESNKAEKSENISKESNCVTYALVPITKDILLFVLLHKFIFLGLFYLSNVITIALMDSNTIGSPASPGRFFYPRMRHLHMVKPFIHKFIIC